MREDVVPRIVPHKGIVVGEGSELSLEFVFGFAQSRAADVGREGLAPTDLTGARTTALTTSDDKMVVAGWVLDKWKFLPMMTET